MRGRRALQLVQLALHGLLHGHQGQGDLVLTGGARLRGVLVADGRLIGAHLLAPEQLADRGHRADVRMHQQRVQRLVRLLDARRDGDVAKDVLAKQPFGEHAIGVGVGQVQPSLVLLPLALALLQAVHRLFRAQEANQLEGSGLVARGRGDHQGPAAGPGDRTTPLRGFVPR